VRSFTCVKLNPPLLPRRIKFLEHSVNFEGICPDPKKVEVVQNWPVPKNVHEVRSFLGLANYFRKFISHYSEVAALLTNLRKKSHV
jgi:hypothetical protein